MNTPPTAGAISPAESRPPSASELNAAAGRALAKGDHKPARELLEIALKLEPRNPALWVNLAAAHRLAGDLDAALAAVDSALREEPRFFHGLMARAGLLERQGKAKRAALAYGRALSQAPAPARLDPATQQALAHAREVNRGYVAELGQYLRQELGAQLDPGSEEGLRVQLFIDATLGTRQIYRQEPTEFCYPGLPAIEFYPRERFPWLEPLEAATPTIRAELLEVLKADAGFEPYVKYDTSLPLDQWAALNGSLSWSAFHFLHQGRRFEENCARCPRTVEVLAGLPQPRAVGRMPAAMFSVLRPRTHIPAHTGVANVRLVIHLPLLVPPGCRFRVGNQTREWQEGRAWVFDDTLEHEAWNDSDQVRVILLCDVWHPDLSASERELITATLDGMHRFSGLAPEERI